MQLLPWHDMENLTRLFGLIAERTPEDTPVQCARVRLAACSSAVLTTTVVDDPVGNALIVAEWRSAGVEYELLAAQAGL